MRESSVTKTKGSQRHPKGPLITVDAEERARLKKLREAREIEQKDLARIAGTSAATIGRWLGEAGRTAPAAAVARLLAERLAGRQS
jgi:DNA-binding transcriptional regulator YiaG